MIIVYTIPKTQVKEKESKWQKKKKKQAVKEEMKQMIPTLRSTLHEVTSGLDELNGLLKKITRS